MKIFHLLTLAALLAAPLAAQDKGSDIKGKYFYKKDCKTCHGDQGPAVTLTPLSKTQAQWGQFFDAGKHGRDGEPLTPRFATPQHVLDIRTFLINHAADSPQPETCGG